MRKLRWSCGVTVTRIDRIRNEVVRGKIKVTEVLYIIESSGNMVTVVWTC